MAYRPGTPAVRAGGHGMSIDTEHADDIIVDLEHALAASK